MSVPLDFPDRESTTYLIDASIPIFRAWFGIPDHFFDKQGRSMNAVYGYGQFLLGFLAKAQPQRVVVAFDESLFTGFRHQIYPEYKANRALPDDELVFQLDTCKALTEMLGMKVVASPRYEADDLIASVARKRRTLGDHVVVVSSDKDLAQIIQPGDYIWDYYRDQLLSYVMLTELWGFPPGRVADYLALVGDSVDNIPGIAGFGAKTGRAVFAHFEGIDHLYENLHELDGLKLRGTKQLMERLRAQESEARLFYRLTLLKDNAKCSWSNKAVKLADPQQHALLHWWEQSGLKRALKLDQLFNE